MLSLALSLIAPFLQSFPSLCRLYLLSLILAVGVRSTDIRTAYSASSASHQTYLRQVTGCCGPYIESHLLQVHDVVLGDNGEAATDATQPARTQTQTLPSATDAASVSEAATAVATRTRRGTVTAAQLVDAVTAASTQPRDTSAAAAPPPPHPLAAIGIAPSSTAPPLQRCYFIFSLPTVMRLAKEDNARSSSFSPVLCFGVQTRKHSHSGRKVYVFADLAVSAGSIDLRQLGRADHMPQQPPPTHMRRRKLWPGSQDCLHHHLSRACTSPLMASAYTCPIQYSRS